MKKNATSKIEGLADLFKMARTKAELVNLLDNLCTPAELDKFYDRIRIIDCLDQGLSQRVTLQKTKTAIATITRGAFLLRQGNVFLVKLIRRARNLSWWHKLFWRA